MQYHGGKRIKEVGGMTEHSTYEECSRVRGEARGDIGLGAWESRLDSIYRSTIPGTKSHKKKKQKTTTGTQKKGRYKKEGKPIQ